MFHLICAPVHSLMLKFFFSSHFIPFILLGPFIWLFFITHIFSFSILRFYFLLVSLLVSFVINKKKIERKKRRATNWWIVRSYTPYRSTKFVYETDVLSFFFKFHSVKVLCALNVMYVHWPRLSMGYNHFIVFSVFALNFFLLLNMMKVNSFFSF